MEVSMKLIPAPLWRNKVPQPRRVLRHVFINADRTHELACKLQKLRQKMGLA